VEASVAEAAEEDLEGAVAVPEVVVDSIEEAVVEASVAEAEEEVVIEAVAEAVAADLDVVVEEEALVPTEVHPKSLSPLTRDSREFMSPRAKKMPSSPRT
jgi:hypothetical protein